MNCQFYEGQELEAIFFSNNEVIKTGTEKCDRITVVFEKGPSSLLPWFTVWYKGKPISKWNSLIIEGVALFSPENLQ